MATKYTPGARGDEGEGPEYVSEGEASTGVCTYTHCIHVRFVSGFVYCGGREIAPAFPNIYIVGGRK